jgi:hypothetical protein
MAPPKGQTNNPAGRPKGSQNKLTKEKREALADLLSGEIDRIPEYIAQLEGPKEKLEMLAKFMPYVVPKLNAVDVNPNQDIEDVPLIANLDVSDAE